jgi:hypothetical protein
MLGISVLALTLSSQTWIMAVITAGLLLLRLVLSQGIKLRKWWLYAAVVPFGIWFLLAPTIAVPRIGTISLWAIWIPAWYFALLGCVQILTLGQGGELRFVWWNAAAVLALGGVSEGYLYLALICLWTFLWCVDLRLEAVGRSTKIPGRTWIWWVGMVLVTFMVAWSWARVEHRFWRLGVERAIHNAMHGQMRGFEPVSWLGSFSSEYESSYEAQTVLRVFTQDTISFMRIIVHSTYAQGVWRSLPQTKLLRPERSLLEYSVFRFGGDPSRSIPIWIQQSVQTGGFIALPSDAGAVAIVADSLNQSSSGVLNILGQMTRSGYFVYRSGFIDSSSSEEYLQVPERLTGLLDSIWKQIPMEQQFTEPKMRLNHLQLWFANTFRYTLQPRLRSGEDPLRTFFRERAGYCEYFGTAATLLLRRAGIQARYVTGFAYPERIGDAWVFRRTNAHGWVEVLIPDQGWTIFDPTPPVAFPQRKGWTVLYDIQEYVAGQLTLIFHAIQDGAWKLRVDAWGAYLQNTLKTVRFWGVLTPLILGIGLWRLRLKLRQSRIHHSQVPASQSAQIWQARLAQAEKRLAKQGFVRAPYETVGDFLLRLGTEADRDALHLLMQYQQERFRTNRHM